jgi:AcrR family transcriptional regulator
MSLAERRARDRAARRSLITTTARTLAEQEGWDAVTTRRLSNEIEYSQPVLYKHFASMEEIADAVALEGFAELAETLRAARRGSGQPHEKLTRAAHAYINFAGENPALYDAMFTRATRLPFGARDRPAPLSAAFAELRETVTAVARGRDIDTLTEVTWAALHGLVTLARNNRLRPSLDDERVQILVAALSDAGPEKSDPSPESDTLAT